MVGETMVDQHSASLSLYCDRVYFKVSVGLPKILAFLVENAINDGSSVIVQGRLKVDNYTINKGARATSHSIIAQKIRLDSKVEIGINRVDAVENGEELTAVQLVQRLRSSNMLDGETRNMAQITENERVVLNLINNSFMVVTNGANADDLLTRLLPLVNRIVTRDATLSVDHFLELLPDGVSRGQASTRFDQLTPELDSQPSTRPQSRQQEMYEMED
ncbi:hypothetical protein BDC45DRAFT_352202 [Circinella umbellata]|nr:hypothetical protein BDC45DRAFT_352202 [Circinella umbellata]